MGKYEKFVYKKRAERKKAKSKCERFYILKMQQYTAESACKLAKVKYVFFASCNFIDFFVDMSNVDIDTESNLRCILENISI